MEPKCASYENQLQVDSGRYEINQLPGNPGFFNTKQSNEITQVDELYSFTCVIKVFNKKTLHTYEQILGLPGEGEWEGVEGDD